MQGSYRNFRRRRYFSPEHREFNPAVSDSQRFVPVIGLRESQRDELRRLELDALNDSLGNHGGLYIETLNINITL